MGCWSHARRYFVDAVKVNKNDGEAVKMITRMGAVFAVDRGASGKQMTIEERLASRRELSEEWV